MALSTHLGDYTIRENTRPEWLTDDTGARLELDFFIEELDVAIEVQGAQHYVYIEHYHKNHEGFVQALQRDEFKRRECYLKGIKLYEVASSGDLFDAVESIQLSIEPEPFIPTDMLKVKMERRNRKGAKARAQKRIRKDRVYKKILYTGLKKRTSALLNILSNSGDPYVAYHRDRLKIFCEENGILYQTELFRICRIVNVSPEYVISKQATNTITVQGTPHPLIKCSVCEELRSSARSIETRDPEFAGTNTCKACRRRIRRGRHA